jgi:prefoldin subunit 5
LTYIASYTTGSLYVLDALSLNTLATVSVGVNPVALDAVSIAISDLISVLEKIASGRAQLANELGLRPEQGTAIQAELQRLDTEGRTLYRRCMLEMRKDCGFSSAAEYRLVGF